MSKLTIDDIERTSEYVQFIHDLKQFHISKGTTLQVEPVLGGKKIDLYKLFEAVSNSGGFDQVTKNRTWKQIGDSFDFPPTCTNSAYILKGLYIRNLIGWEEEKRWGRTWIPPTELLGPDAHKASTLAGKSFKKIRNKQQNQIQQQQQQQLQQEIHNHQYHHYNHHHHHYHPIQKACEQPNQSIIPHQDDPCIHDQPFTPDIFAQFTAQFVPPSDRDIISESHSCSISEYQHQNQPSYHDHSNKKSSPVHTSFDSDTKQHILTALQYGSHTEVELALKNMVTISFECPEELRLDRNPYLLDNLLKIAEISLQQSDEAECMMEHTLQILHILRNFSFIEENAQLLADSSQLKQMMIKNLVLSSSHYTHCIDVLENIATHINIGPSDNYILCLASLVYTNERHVLLGSMRVLTLLSLNKNNQTALIPGSAQTAERILQLLIVNDEEVIGTALEYLYQYTRISNAFRLQLLTIHSGADIGILVSLLMAKTRFFKPHIIKEEIDKDEPMSGSSHDSSTITENGYHHQLHHHQSHHHHHYSNNSALSSPSATSPAISNNHSDLPCAPNLTSYQDLDEPYRCLGWLKDKFELGDSNSVLSLDDMYLLYEIRFGHEKALKVKDFYTVLKIAFPRTSSPLAGTSSPNSAGPVLEGTYVRGIQIKISILQDGSDILCQWTNCSQTFQDELLLQRHILNDHIERNADTCKWTDCGKPTSFDDKMDIAIHLRTHFGDDGEYNKNISNSDTIPIINSINNNNSSNENGNGSIDDNNNSNSDSNQLTIDTLPVKGISLVAAHLLCQLSKDPKSHVYFMPYERELTLISQQRPKLASYIQTIFSNFQILI